MPRALQATVGAQRVDACAADEIDEEDVMRWDRGGRTHALYHSPDGGVLLHRRAAHPRAGAPRGGGRAMDHVIECPKHNGQFDYRTGAAIRAPVCVNLATYPARVEGGRVLAGLS